jgi:hypothetical protein
VYVEGIPIMAVGTMGTVVIPGAGVLLVPVGGTTVRELGIPTGVGEGMLMPGVAKTICEATAVCVPKMSSWLSGVPCPVAVALFAVGVAREVTGA